MLLRGMLAAGLLLGGATLALADSDKTAPAGSMSTAQVSSQLESQGYHIGKIEFDDGRYKVKATDASGHKAKLSVDPRSGNVVSKDDDD